jgi:hypothetical protein
MSRNDQLGEFENLALLAVLRLGEGAYGAQIQEELERTGDHRASISAIYGTLMRLQEIGSCRGALANYRSAGWQSHSGPERETGGPQLPMIP